MRRRSWSQRGLLGLNCLVIVACFGTAGGLIITRHYGNNISRVDLQDTYVDSPDTTAAAADGGEPTTTIEGAPPATDAEAFPAVNPEAQNFLITGADNGACIDPDSPFAGAFADREGIGERSDTIMMVRVDPEARTAAVLSFPRDLYLPIHGRGKGKINSAYVRDDPDTLIKTIAENFYLGVNHFIQVDFCAFKTIVDAVDGVTVPFEFPARDENTGLFVPEPGCFTFSGEHALAYVRSRHYQKYVDGKWVDDGTGDLGRVSRQEDFLRRVLSSALSKGFNPSVARGIMDAVQDFVVVDRELTPGGILEFAGLMSDVDPESIATYQIKSTSSTVSNGTVSVQLPQIKGDNMKAILAIFRGEAPMAGGSTEDEPTDTTTPGTTPVGTVDPNVPPVTGTVVEPTGPTFPDEEPQGIVPPKDSDC